MPDADDLAVEIATAIANQADVDPATLEPPLYDVIDVDALAATVESTGPSHTEFAATFTYGEYVVRVDGAGGVRVDPATCRNASATNG